MKLQRTTLVLLITATLLGGVVYYSEIQRTQNQEATKTTKEPIFSFKEDQIQSVTLYTAQETLEFNRVTGKTTNWRMKQPKEAPASDAAVAFLLNLLAEGKSDRSFFVPTKERQEYGFNQPFATVKVQLNNKENYRLILGKPDFNRSFIYAHVDPSPQSPEQLKVLLVPIDFEYAVNRPISEWQGQSEKPKSPKPSPSATASPKPSPSVTASPKPSPSATASPKPSPSATASPKPSPSATASPKPSPSATASPKPSPTSASPKPSPSATASPKPSPTSASPKPSPSVSATPKPSPTSASPKPSPSDAKPKPSPSTTPSPKPSPSAEKPKPSSSTTPSPKPSPSPQKPKPSST